MEALTQQSTLPQETLFISNSNHKPVQLKRTWKYSRPLTIKLKLDLLHLSICSRGFTLHTLKDWKEKKGSKIEAGWLPQQRILQNYCEIYELPSVNTVSRARSNINMPDTVSWLRFLRFGNICKVISVPVVTPEQHAFLFLIWWPHKHKTPLSTWHWNYLLVIWKRLSRSKSSKIQVYLLPRGTEADFVKMTLFS